MPGVKILSALNHYFDSEMFVACRKIQDLLLCPLSMTVLLRGLFTFINLRSLWYVSKGCLSTHFNYVLHLIIILMSFLFTYFLSI